MGLDCYVLRKVPGPSKEYPDEHGGEYHYEEVWYSRKFYKVHEHFSRKLDPGENDNCEYFPIDEEDIAALTNLLIINGVLNHEIDEFRQKELSNLIEILKSQETLDDLYYWGWY